MVFLAIAFAANVLYGKSPIDDIDATLDVLNKQTRLIQCLESQHLVPFSKSKI